MASNAFAEDCKELCDGTWWETATIVDVMNAMKTADIDARGPSGATALHIAAIAGTTDVITAMVAAQYDINAQNNIGYMPLNIATMFGPPENVATLVNLGAGLGPIR